MKKRNRKFINPLKSLRTIMIFWFLILSIVPVAFITFYSLDKYQESLNNVMKQRLESNQREIKRIISDLEKNVSQSANKIARQKGLSYYLYRNLKKQIVESAMEWMNSNVLIHKLSIYDRNGALVVSLQQDENGKINRDKMLERGDLSLSKEFINGLEKNKSQAKIIEFNNNETLSLISFNKILTEKGILLGYLEESVLLNKEFFNDLKKKLDIDFLIFDKHNIIKSGEDFSNINLNFLKKLYQDGQRFAKTTLNSGQSYSFLLSDLTWGSEKVVFVVVASNSQIQKTLANIQFALFSMVIIIILFLFVVSFIISKLVLKPLYILLEATENMNITHEFSEIPVKSSNELGQLTKSFNNMVSEVRESQIQLVHSEKMASIGQLVAGVAHELNNPIGFINSNMVHLQEYTDGLIELIKLAEKDPEKFKKRKEELDFDYMVEDLPKLINSCKEGSQRTKDIVLGLRSFSRIDEADLKEVDIHEGLKSTLDLLSGELKNRIKVNLNFSDLPMVRCFPSQLNQVFMNILSNAAHAIEDTGEIGISTKSKGDNVVIEISDSGHGMDKDTQSKIFDPFFTTKEQGKGTGLGMSISFGIINKHQGHISVVSEKAKGTTFTIVLPVDGPQDI